MAFDVVTVRASGHMVPAYAPQRAMHVIFASLLGNRPLAPSLPSGWDTEADESFYGYATKAGGSFSKWVVGAMSPEFVGGDDSSGSGQKRSKEL